MTKDKTMMKTSYSIQRNGNSRSFPETDAFLAGSQGDGEVLILIGDRRLDASEMVERKAVLIELGAECLSVHTGGSDTVESSNVIGFARWRLGNNPPSNLVELVVESGTKADSIAAAKEVFEAAGFVVSLSADRLGRIVDRLIRPQFNLVLRAVDDGLADPKDLEQCLNLGLGYRKGVLVPLLASGLEHHYDVTSALFEVYGQAQYAPARQAIVAKKRHTAGCEQ